VIKAGKAAGVLTADNALARQYLKAGATFVAVGVDTTLLVRGARALAAEFKSGKEAGAPASSGGY
jgi:4-hydroxy-2-oxoheptanedioate aldolase